MNVQHQVDRNNLDCMVEATPTLTTMEPDDHRAHLKHHGGISPTLGTRAVAVFILLLALVLPPKSQSLVTNREVSPHAPVNHDTFLFLCSLDVNEQNFAVRAYREYQKMYRETTWLQGVLPYTETLDGQDQGFGVGSLNGKDQPKYWESTKGCAYRSDFNAGDEEG